MRTLALAAAATLLLGTPATAGPPDGSRYYGGCGFNAVAPASSPDTFTGEMDGVVAAYSAQREHNPVTVVSLTCTLQVNGTTVAEHTVAGVGPVAVLPPTPITYVATESDWVMLCDTVVLVDAHGQRREIYCPEGVEEIPPSWVWDTLDPLWDPLWEPLRAVDAAVCAQLQALAPTQVKDYLRIDPGGDVYVAGGLFWDCPPYETT